MGALNRSIKLHIPSRVTDPEASRLDTTDGGRADDENTLLAGLPEDLTSVALRDTFSDDGDRFDLRELKNLLCARVDGTRRGKVDDDIDIGVLLDGLREGGVDGQQRLLRAPVELLDVVTAEG